MIRSFRSRALKAFWEDGDSSKLHGSVDRIKRILDILNAAEQPEQLNLPGLHYHKLAGKPIRYSVRVTANWRITFEWENEDASRINYEDYH